jgi:hypothetical protein
MQIQNHWKFRIKRSKIRRSFPLFGTPSIISNGLGSICEDERDYIWTPTEVVVNLNTLNLMHINFKDYGEIEIPFRCIKHIDICRVEGSKITRRLIFHRQHRQLNPPQKLSFKFGEEFGELFLSLAIELCNKRHITVRDVIVFE